MTSVAGMGPLRHQNLNGLAHKFFSPVAKRALCRLVHQDNPPFAIHFEDGVGGRIEKLSKALLQASFLGKIQFRNRLQGPILTDGPRRVYEKRLYWRVEELVAKL